MIIMNLNDKKNEDIEMIDDNSINLKSINERSNLLTSSLLPQRIYLANRTGQYLSRKQKLDQLKRKDQETDNELNFNIKKLRVN